MLAVVTGASRGLGRLCAFELAAHGADLLLVGRDQVALADVASEIRAKCPRRRVTTLARDLSDPEAPRYVREAADRLGPADILVNNAAVQGPIGPAWEVPWTEFEQALRFDLLVPIALCLAVIPSMKAKGRGWIINISGGGATSPRPMFTAYAAAKTALVRFTETLAIETAGYGIRVNAVSPGAFASNMTTAVHAAAEKAGAAEAAAAQKLLDRRRYGKRRGSGPACRLFGAGRGPRCHQQTDQRRLGPVGLPPSSSRGGRARRCFHATPNLAAGVKFELG